MAFLTVGGVRINCVIFWGFCKFVQNFEEEGERVGFMSIIIKKYSWRRSLNQAEGFYAS